MASKCSKVNMSRGDDATFGMVHRLLIHVGEVTNHLGFNTYEHIWCVASQIIWSLKHVGMVG